MEPNLPLNGGQKKTFFAPSGFKYTIREQNGADDDVLSNPEEAKTLTNLARFVAGIVVETDSTKSGKLNTKDAYNLPILDVYAIILQSRIHSIGKELEFTYNWPGENGKPNQVNYVIDLGEFLFSTYDVNELTEEETIKKPDAISLYPETGSKLTIEGKTTSGKAFSFKLMTLKSESYKVNLPLSKQTKNQDLVARNFMVEINGQWEKVNEFSYFTKKDLNEIRAFISENDPTFTGNAEIEHPETGEKATISIFGINDFFFPGEI